MLPGLISKPTVPLQLGPFSKSKRPSSRKWKSLDFNTQQKCRGPENHSDTPRISAQDLFDDREWSLDLDISTEDDPVTQNIVHGHSLHLLTSAAPSINPPPPPPPPLPPVERPHFRCYRCENILRIQQELSGRRTRLLTARTHLKNEQALLTSLREFESKSRELVIKAVATALEYHRFGDDLAEITNLQSISITASKDLKDGEIRFSKAQDQLSSVEYHFGKKETELYALLSYTHIQVGSLQSDVLESALHGSESVAETESASLPSLLEEYYDKAGDANLAWDRLQELETEHQIELQLRKRAVEENIDVVPPETEFVRSFVEKRIGIVLDLLHAKATAQGLRRQCEERDYSIKDESGFKALQDYDFDLWADGSDRYLQLRLVGEVDRKERVEDWVKGDIHAPDFLTTLTRHPLWETRRAFSEVETKLPPDSISQFESVAGDEVKTGSEIFEAPKAPNVEKNVAQTSPILMRVGSNFDRASTSYMTTWRPEVSLKRRCSSPEIWQSTTPG
ncbi:hypothetical protein BLS_000815 [Venturia inaequalis]|uniref:Uncharacterized protein n=1 Tax=Venturia inaequalis TaxID=5025 RepID=A0A8H3ZIK9_VENIN|nr:hypothetical protein BLS_000815 [Venturia inaequalis]KAE9994857.1 hypothetical protein EG327_000071 [Venturia inaequalis]RDI83732.1 Mitochondrial distribution and morphology protein 34 [Venturia inaequalis]